MEKRLRTIRKALGLSQEQLGQALGVSNTAISKLENGENNITEQNIKAICREFDVNENWLRTGQGEMFVELTPDEEFDKLCLEIQLSDDELIKKIMRTYWHLSKEERQGVQKMIDSISNKQA